MVSPCFPIAEVYKRATQAMPHQKATSMIAKLALLLVCVTLAQIIRIVEALEGTGPARTSPISAAERNLLVGMTREALYDGDAMPHMTGKKGHEDLKRVSHGGFIRLFVNQTGIYLETPSSNTDNTYSARMGQPTASPNPNPKGEALTRPTRCLSRTVAGRTAGSGPRGSGPDKDSAHTADAQKPLPQLLQGPVAKPKSAACLDVCTRCRYCCPAAQTAAHLASTLAPCMLWGRHQATAGCLVGLPGRLIGFQEMGRCLVGSLGLGMGWVSASFHAKGKRPASQEELIRARSAASPAAPAWASID
ncbi:hypothetical protein GWK47_035568 [Chionoecetes opilio]|uniref:Uncharacterized protein n=1 Tax=Chionoecetes opilio TaxID=41210 RepID=A0A8J5CNI1_CHIOP|nr:hypothetical protein GWK47_035568 [Chionoecetes opilio]